MLKDFLLITKWTLEKIFYINILVVCVNEMSKFNLLFKCCNKMPYKMSSFFHKYGLLTFWMYILLKKRTVCCRGHSFSFSPFFWKALELDHSSQSREHNLDHLNEKEDWTRDYKGRDRLAQSRERPPTDPAI